jgi:hypothetical protein
MADLIPLGTETVWGRVSMVAMTGGERYYWMVDKDGAVSMMPAFHRRGRREWQGL